MRPLSQFSTKKNVESCWLQLPAHSALTRCWLAWSHYRARLTEHKGWPHPANALHFWGALGCYFLGNRTDAAASLWRHLVLPTTSRFLRELWSWCLPWDKEHRCLQPCQELTWLKKEAGQEEGGWQRCCWNYTTRRGSSITGKTKEVLSCSYIQIFLISSCYSYKYFFPVSNVICYIHCIILFPVCK